MIFLQPTSTQIKQISSLLFTDCQVDHIGTQFVTGFLGLNSTLETELLIIPQVADIVNVSVHAPAWPDMLPIQEQLSIGHSRVFSLTSDIRMKAEVDVKGNLLVRRILLHWFVCDRGILKKSPYYVHH